MNITEMFESWLPTARPTLERLKKNLSEEAALEYAYFAGYARGAQENEMRLTQEICKILGFPETKEREAMAQLIAEVRNINRKVDKLMAGQAELKAAIEAAVADINAEFDLQLAAIDAEAQKIIDAVAAGLAPDTTDLINQINGARDAFKARLDGIAGQLPTEPTPPPQPA